MAAMNVPCLLYADDIKIYTTIHGIDDCENLQKNLNVVSDWCELNQLPINKKKSVVMSYGLKHKLNNAVKGSARLNAQSLITIAGILSGPAVYLGFN